MNQKPNCPRCKCEKFRLEEIRFENLDSESDDVEDVIICAGCGAIIGARDPFGERLANKIMDKLGIDKPSM